MSIAPPLGTVLGSTPPPIPTLVPGGGAYIDRCITQSLLDPGPDDDLLEV